MLCHIVPSKQTLNYTVRTVPGDIPVFLSAVQSFTCSVPNLEIEGLGAMNTHKTFKKADSVTFLLKMGRAKRQEFFPFREDPFSNGN